MKRCALLVLVTVTLTGCMSAPSEVRPPWQEPVRPTYLPTVGAVNGWEPAGPATYFNASNLYLELGTQAAKYRDYHVLELVRAPYHIGLDGQERLDVSVFRMDGEVNAFGIWSMERPSDGEAVEVGSGGTITDRALDFAKGEYFVRLKLDRDMADSRESLLAFARHMAANLPGSSALPGSFSAFPDGNRVPQSERFVAREYLGVEHLNGVYEAGYQVYGRAGSMWLMQTGSEGEALGVLTALRAQLGRTGTADVELPDGWQAGFWGKDKQMGTLFVFQRGVFVGGCRNITDRVLARRMASELAARLPW